MEEKKKRLMELVEELNFPLLPEENRKHLENLNEEDLDELISAYEAISDYKHTISEVAQSADPEKYRKVQEEYNKKFEQLNLDLTGESEKIQAYEDLQKDQAEENNSQKVDKVVERLQKEIGQIDDAAQELASKIELGTLTQE